MRTPCGRFSIYKTTQMLPTDFKIKLKDRQESYDTAKANYDRAVTLVKKGVISKVDHDNWCTTGSPIMPTIRLL